MTREEIARNNAKKREIRSKKLVISAITGLYSDNFRKGKKKDKWHIQDIAKFTNLTRQTVSKHIKLWEANKGGLFEEELGTVEGIKQCK
jgi:sarcosine oxidase delta subunit